MTSSKLITKHGPAHKEDNDPKREAQIAKTDKEIDALVYQLYGLTEEEIAVVEGKS